MSDSDSATAHGRCTADTRPPVGRRLPGNRADGTAEHLPDEGPRVARGVVRVYYSARD